MLSGLNYIASPFLIKNISSINFAEYDSYSIELDSE